jgi:hypothetical protein
MRSLRIKSKSGTGDREVDEERRRRDAKGRRTGRVTDLGLLRPTPEAVTPPIHPCAIMAFWLARVDHVQEPLFPICRDWVSELSRRAETCAGSEPWPKPLPMSTFLGTWA